MDLKEFEKNYGTEEQCLDYLFRLRWKYGYRCPRCNHNEMWEIKNYKYKCRKCGYQTTVIAGTLFQDTHIPLTVWFRAVWYLTEQPNITVLRLQKELNIGSNRTVLKLLSKLNRTKVQTTFNKLQGIIEVSKHFIKVGNNGFWIAIAVEIDNKKIGCIRLSKIENTADSVQSFIKNNIEEKSMLICREMIDIKEYVKVKKAYTYEFPYTKKVILKLNSWIFNSVSLKKSTQELLNEFCALYNSHKTKITFNEMLKNAVNLPPLPDIEPFFKGI